MKKIILSIFLCVAILLSASTTIVVAAESDAITETDIEECFEKQLPSLIEIEYSSPSDFDLEEFPSKINIGNAFRFSMFDEEKNIYTNNQTLYFPLYDGEKIFAILSMSKYKGDVCVTIGKDFSAELNKLLSSDDEVTLFDDGNALYAITENECLFLSLGGYTLEAEKLPNANYSFSQVIAKDSVIRKNEIIQSIDVSQIIASRSVGTSVYLSNYSIVNQIINGTQVGVCWASTIASMARFEMPSVYGGLAAKNVCDAIGHSYTGAGWTDIMGAMNYYFTSPYVPTLLNYSLSPSSVMTVINNNDPALMGCLSGSSAHITALCGYSMGSSYFSIRIMNPGSASFQTSVYSSSSYSFSFGGKVYTWDKTVRLYY